MSVLKSYLKNYAIKEASESAGSMADPIAAMLTRQLITNKAGNSIPGSNWGGGTVPATGDYQDYAKKLARKRFGPGHWKELNELVTRESSWNPQADNPTSTAYGLFQFLDSTRENYNLDINANPYKQVRKGLKYIADRYGNPTEALGFHDQNNWY